MLTKQAGEIVGDLFVDCSGFAALLIGKTLGVGFKECGDVLFCDTALAVQVPFETPDAPMASQTISTAHAAGWTWDIGLPTRRGVGYVYSSRHSSEEAARETLLRYIGAQHRELPVRKIPIRAGHRATFWKRNCVAVGLASGFLEPLESSAIVLVELSAKLLAEQMPACREVMDIVAKRFNEVTMYRFGRIIDFLKLHYVLTKRTDSAFWRDNVDPATVPERLQRSADAVEVPVAVVLRRARPAGGGLSRGELPVRALRHGIRDGSHGRGYLSTPHWPRRGCSGRMSAPRVSCARACRRTASCSTRSTSTDCSRSELAIED